MDIIAFDDRTGQAQFTVESDTLTNEMKDRFTRAFTDVHDLGYDLHLKRFFEKDYPKVSSGSLMGEKAFNLAEVLGVKDLLDTKAISECSMTIRGSDASGWAALQKPSMASQASASSGESFLLLMIRRGCR